MYLITMQVADQVMRAKKEYESLLEERCVSVLLSILCVGHALYYNLVPRPIPNFQTLCTLNTGLKLGIDLGLMLRLYGMEY